MTAVAMRTHTPYTAICEMRAVDYLRFERAVVQLLEQAQERRSEGK